MDKESIQFSLRAVNSRLESWIPNAGMFAVNGSVAMRRIWIGPHDDCSDWYDRPHHVSAALRLSCRATTGLNLLDSGATKMRVREKVFVMSRPKSLIIISLTIGFFISTALLAMEWLTGDTAFWFNWQMPGINAAFYFWDATGGSATAGLVVAWIVNALAYGAFVCVFLGAFEGLKSLSSR